MEQEITQKVEVLSKEGNSKGQLILMGEIQTARDRVESGGEGRRSGERKLEEKRLVCLFLIILYFIVVSGDVNFLLIKKLQPRKDYVR